jgi:hypothetical protein
MYNLFFLWYNNPIIKERGEFIMKNKIFEAQQFACDYFNIPRQEFVEKAALRYPSVKNDAKYFLYAVKAYDEIQNDMKEVA